MEEKTREFTNLLRISRDTFYRSLRILEERESFLKGILLSHDTDLMRSVLKGIADGKDETECKTMMAHHYANVCKLRKRMEKGLASITNLQDLILFECVDIENYDDVLKSALESNRSVSSKDYEEGEKEE